MNFGDVGTLPLSTWFRDYVFLPLMNFQKNSQRKSTKKSRKNAKKDQKIAIDWPALSLFLTFTLSGFWHGAAWNFIIWGAYHGALLLVLRYLGRPFYGFVGDYIPRPQILSWFLTFASVTLGCLFFMETNSKTTIN
jgi:alginate O-acetyltransferase complex protein AlgI